MAVLGAASALTVAAATCVPFGLAGASTGAAANAQKPGQTSQAVATPTQQCTTFQSGAVQAPSVSTDQIWAQQALDFQDAWPITTGKGVTVAVVDSGISADIPQLQGKVIGSQNFSGGPNRDCYGHGTAVAGIIAASDMQQQTHNARAFLGVAPGVKLISIKVQNSEDDGSVASLAQGIEEAVSLHAQIINVSIQSCPSPLLQLAVDVALASNVLVVAAAGNTEEGNNSNSSSNSNCNNQAQYPASYKGVLSVAAANSDGTPAQFNVTQSRVDVLAPGVGIVSTAMAGGYLENLEGTSFATPYVTGAAALILSKYPGMTPAQVIQRIDSTADGNVGPGTGHGMIDPYNAVTDDIAAARSEAAVNASPKPIHIAGPPWVDHRTRNMGVVVGLAGAGAALLAGFAGIVYPIGRRRGWRPGHRAPLPDKPTDGTGSAAQAATDGSSPWTDD
jgi:type VII secretion-associated serine protease mycosin